MMQNLLVMKTEEHMMKKERWEKDMMLEQRRLQMEERLQWELYFQAILLLVHAPQVHNTNAILFGTACFR
jgi:hypothetical protein